MLNRIKGKHTLNGMRSSLTFVTLIKGLHLYHYCPSSFHLFLLFFSFLLSIFSTRNHILLLANHPIAIITPQPPFLLPLLSSSFSNPKFVPAQIHGQSGPEGKENMLVYVYKCLFPPCLLISPSPRLSSETTGDGGNVERLLNTSFLPSLPTCAHGWLLLLLAARGSAFNLDRGLVMVNRGCCCVTNRSKRLMFFF